MNSSYVNITSSPQGLQWVQLSAEEIPSRIQAITGKRGRPRNTEKSKSKEVPKVKRGRGRPPKVRVPELLTKADHRLLKEPEAQGTVELLLAGSCSLSEAPGVADWLIPGFSGRVQYQAWVVPM